MKAPEPHELNEMDTFQKMERVLQLSEAITRAREINAQTPSYDNLLAVQQLLRDRSEIHALLPKFSVVE